MSTIFTRIVNGEIPCHKVAEDSAHLAFLDVKPIGRGHVLVIPKKEVDYIFDMDETAFQALHSFARKVAVALKKVIPCKKIGVAVIGLEVPHVHIHLVPMNEIADLNFTGPRLELTADDLSAIASSIAGAL